MKILKNKKVFKVMIGVLLITVWICWDISQANKWGYMSKGYLPAKNVDSITSATSKVSIIPSNYSSLASPTARSSELSYEQVEDMVRKAIDEAGGIDWLIKADDMVLLKPNIVEREVSGCGEITDVRVIKALVKIIDELSPGNIEIVIGEGSPRPMDYEVPYSIGFKTAVWETLWDVPGYQALLSDPYLAGINLRLSNLNGSPPENPWQDLIPIDVSGGGVATPHNSHYYIHKDVLNADVFITVPVLKSHKVGMSGALKNMIGVAPSTRYGFSKTGGVPQDGYANKLVHRAEEPRDWVDEEVVDLSTLAEIDFVVIDAINCLETSKEALWQNGSVSNLVKMNCIIAGPDPVAVDHVCAKIIGLNPDDLAYLTLAERVGLGTNNPDNISVEGSSIESVKRPFKKDPFYTSDYGQGNRQWILSGPFSAEGIDNPMDYPFLTSDATLLPRPGENGWSDEIYFLDDRIDLREYYDDPQNVVSYAACYFTVKEAQTAELWIGSDEPIKIYLNGQLVYNFTGNRSFNRDKLVNDKVNINIQKGENKLIVKTLQTYGYYDFSLNICKIESDSDLDGNRVADLKFMTTPTQSLAAVNLVPSSLDIPKIEAGQLYAVEKFSIKLLSGSTTWQGLDVNIGGNCTTSDIHSIQIWADNGDQVFDKNSDTKIGASTFNNQKVHIDFGRTISTTTGHYFVVMQLTETEPNPDANIVFSWQDQDDFYFNSPVELNTDFPISSQSVSLPVELMSFLVENSNNGFRLVWNVMDEVKLLGYEVQKSLNGIDFEAIKFVPAKQNNLEKNQYTFLDENSGPEYVFYRLRIVDTDGSEELSGMVKAVGAVPQDFKLANPYPNPFNNGTRIEYQLPKAGEINLSIFNTNGQLIKTLAQQYVSSPGTYNINWDGTNDLGATVSTGLYIIVLRTNEFTQVRKAVFSK